MSFYLYPGNRLETLAGIYCRRIYRDPGSDPMVQDTVVVQTQGMAAYLRQFTAQECGIAANMAMPFPEGFISGVLKSNVRGFETASENFSQEELAWRIFAVFQHESADFPELENYFKNRSGELHIWQLARSVAALFDRYQIYRYTDEYFPLTGEHWQTRLWKKLLRSGGKSKIQCYQEFLRQSSPIAGLPRRLTVFGVGSLPPLYLDIFFKIASQIDLHFFYLTPCREFWEELYSVREQRWLNPAGDLPEVGNPLLASWGESGRELFSNLLNHQDSAPYVSTEDLLFGDCLNGEGNGTVLQHIQQDILTMHDARRDKRSLPPDESLEIINCHSPRREIEVLHDKLSLLCHEKKIEPRDVIVMAPDINSYVPYIEAVFAQGPLRSCYTVSDRNLHAGSGIGDVFCELLKLPGSRMDTDSIMSILSNPAVFTAFGMKVDDLSLIGRWLESSGIRWGLDGEDHRKFCGVPFEEYSWYYGIDRMFENFAVGTDELDSIIGTPFTLPEAELELFGKFTRFISSLAKLRNELDVQRDLRQWMEYFQQILENFFKDHDTGSADEITALRRFFTDKWMIGRRLRNIEKFSLEVAQDIVGSFLNTALSRFSFLRGKITFCSLTPLRSIPAKVIAILGMDEGKFPRRDVELSFDLMSSRLLPGDRSGAKEDRYLFLEALMSARRNFWCFYNGRSRRSGKVLQPSVVLGELMDYVEQSYKISEIYHYLHGFDPRYFTKDSPLISTGKSYFRTAKLLASHRAADRPGRKFSTPLEPFVPGSGLQLAEFIKWAKHPLSYIFSHCLEVAFKTPDAGRTREAITAISGLQRYTVDNSIKEFEAVNVEPELMFSRLRRCNILPPGEAGYRTFNIELEKIRRIPAAWRQEFYEQQETAVSFPVSLELFPEPVPVTGILKCSPRLDSQKIMVCSSLKHSNYVDALLRHHALCMISDAPEVTTSLYTHDGKTWILKEWHGSGRDENSRIFWQRFTAAWEQGFRLIPALFPQTLFDMTKNHRTSPEEARDAGFEDEYSSDKFISCGFTADAFKDPQVAAEFNDFFDLFYGGGKS